MAAVVEVPAEIVAEAEAEAEAEVAAEVDLVRQPNEVDRDQDRNKFRIRKLFNQIRFLTQLFLQ